MNRRILSMLGLAVLVASTSCRRSQARGGGFGGSHFSSSYRQELEPAANAQEWLERRSADKDQAWGDILQNWYAELPPQADWPALLEAMEKDLQTAEVETDDSRFMRSSELTPEKERLFVFLLRGDQDGAQKIIRQLVEAEGSRSYSFNRESVLDAVLSLSKDPDEGLEWVKGQQPGLLAERSHGSGKRMEKKPWEKLLADASLEEAIEILRKDLKEPDRGDKLNRLLRLAGLAGDEGLKREVVELLWEDAQKQLKDPSSHHYFGQRALEGALAEAGDWERLKTLSEDRTKAREKQEADSIIVHSNGDALKWFLVYHLDGAETFLKQMDAELAGGELTLTEFYSLLKGELGTGVMVGNLYAEALLAAGRKDEAWGVAQRMVAMNLRKDSHYEQARKVAPGRFSDYLDQLMAFDPFEERPLIWKAELALADGELEEAKAWAEKAIALDPSDGDQGKDSRMKVYEVLSRVLGKAGDEEKSAFFKEVMVSIREGEEADDYLYAGLIREATERYQAALGHFEDAYCLQSRLALTLARDGQFEKAVPHFEKAFELMPVSFGPRESHCFGCEGLFSDERVRPIAKRILSAFMAKHPDNARAPYLLGLVLDSMGDEKEAAEAYRKALELDPRYFNAANRLYQILKKDPTAHAEKTKLVTTLLKIAPYPELGRFHALRTDLRQAWIDAESIAVSPLKLTELPFKPAARTEQFRDGSGSFQWISGLEKSMDGWSRDELCRENGLLEVIEDL